MTATPAWLYQVLGNQKNIENNIFLYLDEID